MAKTPSYQAPGRSERMSRMLLEESQAIKRQVDLKKIKNQEMQRRLEEFERDVLSKRKVKIDE